MPVVRTPVKNRPSNRASRAIRARSHILAFSMARFLLGQQKAGHMAQHSTLSADAALAVFRPHRHPSHSLGKRCREDKEGIRSEDGEHSGWASSTIALTSAGCGPVVSVYCAEVYREGSCDGTLRVLWLAHRRCNVRDGLFQ